MNDDQKLPEDVAREKGHDNIYNRLIEIKFEVSGLFYCTGVDALKSGQSVIG